MPKITKGDRQAPYVSKELLDYLVAVFPDSSVEIDETKPITTDEVAVRSLLRSGEQRIIRKLRKMFEEQGRN